MDKKYINEPYSKIIKVSNGTIYFSGIKAWGLKDGDIIRGTLEEQFTDIITQLNHIFNEHHLSTSHIVKIQCFLSNLDDYDIFNQIYQDWLVFNRPVRSVVKSDLRFKAKLELIIECYEEK